jgi:UDP-glucose 4-epimerase
MKRYFVAGGAGFIGSHLVYTLLEDPDTGLVTVYDNFSSGREFHLSGVKNDPRLRVVRADLKNLSDIIEAMKGHDQVFHFASNPDIARAINQPDIDFWEGTYLTQNLLEAMRINNIKRLVYASGSGIYGDTGFLNVSEDHGPLLPISTYGASKLACEALICAYSHMFDMTARVYRFANVVGPKQTHGVAYDFIKKLSTNPTRLLIFGDGNQSKSYIYIDDVLNAIFLTDRLSQKMYDYFNVATDDYITVKEIADIVVQEMGLQNVHYEFTGGNRGWKGDVPVVRFDLGKIHKMGWRAQLSSKDAVIKSVRLMLKERGE